MDKKKVRDYMTYDVVSIGFHGSVKDVIEKIQKTHHDGFPVMDGDVVVGYVSARDLLFVQPETPVGQVMSANLIVADPEMDINDAARVIFRSGIQKLAGCRREEPSDRYHLQLRCHPLPDRARIPGKGVQFHHHPQKLYGVDPTLDRGTVPVKDLLPTQSKIYEDELEGRIYEIKKGLAEPIIVVKRPGRIILVDGHHRAVAAKRLGITALDAYIIEIKEDIELGMERTATAMNLKTLDDIQVLDYARHPLVAITHRLVKRA